VKALWTRLRGIDALVVDAILALCVLVPSLVALSANPTSETTPTPADALAVLLTVVGCGAIALRRRRPMTALWIGFAATVLFVVRDYPESGLPIASLVLLYSAAANAPRRQWLLGAAAVLGFFVVFALARPEDLSRSNMIGNIAIFGIAAAFGDSNATRRANTEALRARAEALERNQAIEAERAVADERLSIARQLHDIVAHSLAVIAVQSGVGGHVIDTDPEEAKRVLERINGASRETLDEMRRMLGVLRGEDGERASLAPTPDLGDVPRLVEGVQDAGLDIDMVIAGEAENVPAGVELTAYRIVQEALTNVLKHAGPARVQVRVDCDPGVLRVEVTDDGRGATTATDGTAGTHLGLIGMRERVGLYDGELEVGPRSDGGWRVCATLPYERVTA